MELYHLSKLISLFIYSSLCFISCKFAELLTERRDTPWLFLRFPSWNHHPSPGMGDLEKGCSSASGIWITTSGCISFSEGGAVFLPCYFCMAFSGIVFLLPVLNFGYKKGHIFFRGNVLSSLGRQTARQNGIWFLSIMCNSSDNNVIKLICCATNMAKTAYIAKRTKKAKKSLPNSESSNFQKINCLIFPMSQGSWNILLNAMHRLCPNTILKHTRKWMNLTVRFRNRIPMHRVSCMDIFESLLHYWTEQLLIGICHVLYLFLCRIVCLHI